LVAGLTRESQTDGIDGAIRSELFESFHSAYEATAGQAGVKYILDRATRQYIAWIVSDDLLYVALIVNTSLALCLLCIAFVFDGRRLTPALRRVLGFRVRVRALSMALNCSLWVRVRGP
jgi:hypothetical protein